MRIQALDRPDLSAVEPLKIALRPEEKQPWTLYRFTGESVPEAKCAAPPPPTVPPGIADHEPMDTVRRHSSFVKIVNLIFLGLVLPTEFDFPRLGYGAGSGVGVHRGGAQTDTPNAIGTEYRNK